MIEPNLILGDCREVLRTWIAGNGSGPRFTAIVTDPPAGIAFMGKTWDGDHGGRDQWIANMSEIARLCLELCLPGAHALVWALPRTSHWTATAWENGGWEVRDRIAHVFGSGFPKSAAVDKLLDKAAGAEREVVGRKVYADGKTRTRGANETMNEGWQRPWRVEDQQRGERLTAPATDLAREWSGYGSALKPAIEDWWLLRKPLVGSIAENVTEYGCGGLWIDGCRVKTETPHASGAYTRESAPCEIHDTSDVSQSSVRDGLLHIVSALRSCSTYNKDLCHDEADQDDKKPLDAQYDEMLLRRLYPNGSWCGLDLMSIQDSQGDCQPYHHCDDELLRPVQEAAQASAPLLADALERMSSELFESSHSHKRDNARLSNSDVLRLSLSLVQLLSGNTIIPRLAPQCKTTTCKNGAPSGRFPAHLIHDGSAEVVGMFPRVDGPWGSNGHRSQCGKTSMFGIGDNPDNERYKGTGSAARFFACCPADEGDYDPLYYCAKASRRERCDGLEESQPRRKMNELPNGDAFGNNSRTSNHHPTVKPLSLMRYLLTLVRQPTVNLVLDPFMGSGSTGVAAAQLGIPFVGIEQDAEYFEIARRRIAAAGLPLLETSELEITGA